MEVVRSGQILGTFGKVNWLELLKDPVGMEIKRGIKEDEYLA